jgi:hypothetical protein
MLPMQILSAVLCGLSLEGHVYKCKKGHLYVIGEIETQNMHTLRELNKGSNVQVNAVNQAKRVHA